MYYYYPAYKTNVFITLDSREAVIKVRNRIRIITIHSFNKLVRNSQLIPLPRR